MLLFVVATFVVFHFALPAGRRRGRGERAALGRDRLHRAARARARVRARARAAERSTGSCSRRATAARSGSRSRSRRSRSSSPPRSSRCRSSRSSSTGSARRRWPASLLADLGICAVGTFLGAMAVASRAARPAPAAALPAARDPDRGRRRRRERRRPPGPLPRRSSPSTTPSSRSSAGRPSSTSSPNSPAPTICRSSARGRRSPGWSALALVARLLRRAEDADQGFSQRIFYFHVPIALTAYACFGCGAWKALLHLWKRDRAPTSRATSRSTRA